MLIVQGNGYLSLLYDYRIHFSDTTLEIILQKCTLGEEYAKFNEANVAVWNKLKISLKTINLISNNFVELILTIPVFLKTPCEGFHAKTFLENKDCTPHFFGCIPKFCVNLYVYVWGTSALF